MAIDGPQWVKTGLGGPRLVASAARGRAELQTKKADFAARMSALGGRAVDATAWPEPPLIAEGVEEVL